MSNAAAGTDVEILNGFMYSVLGDDVSTFTPGVIPFGHLSEPIASARKRIATCPGGTFPLGSGEYVTLPLPIGMRARFATLSACPSYVTVTVRSDVQVLAMNAAK